MNELSVWKSCFSEAQQVLNAFSSDPENLKKCEQFSLRMIETYKAGGRVFSCGNGGSHCDAMHFAEEMTGRYRKDRRPLGALALGDPSHVTCVANDYGFEYIFSRQVEALGIKGDMLIGISTSGNSKNVINAVQAARQKGMTTVGLLGKGGGQLRELVDLAIVVPGSTADRIQEMHIKILHTVIETVERAIFPEHYS